MHPNDALVALPALGAVLPCLFLGALAAIGVEVVCTRHGRRRAATGADAIAVHGTESADASEAEAARLTVHVGFSGAAVVLIRPRVAAATLAAGPEAAASHSHGAASRGGGQRR